MFEAKEMTPRELVEFLNEKVLETNELDTVLSWCSFLMNTITSNLAATICALAAADCKEEIPRLMSQTPDAMRDSVKRKVAEICEKHEMDNPLDPNAELRNELLRQQGH